VSRLRPSFTPAVGLYFTSADWFTASTSFANSAATLALLVLGQLLSGDRVHER
jgi:hypothetical protein